MVDDPRPPLPNWVTDVYTVLETAQKHEESEPIDTDLLYLRSFGTT
ncbi:hypothetical protein [Haloterrigena turkmenica]|nr:hypothetical protein [Haloterrigena turkmenica]